MLWAGDAIDDAPQTGFMCALSFVYVCRSFFCRVTTKWARH